MPDINIEKATTLSLNENIKFSVLLMHSNRCNVCDTHIKTRTANILLQLSQYCKKKFFKKTTEMSDLFDVIQKCYLIQSVRVRL